MNKEIKGLVSQYWKKEISKETLVTEFDSLLDAQNMTYSSFFEAVLSNQDADILDSLMTIGYALEDENQFIDFVHKTISEPWHGSYVEMAHFLQHN